MIVWKHEQKFLSPTNQKNEKANEAWVKEERNREPLQQMFRKSDHYGVLWKPTFQNAGEPEEKDTLLDRDGTPELIK